METFTDKMIEAIRRKKSILTMGLDPQLRFMPPHLMEVVRSSYGGGTKGVSRLFLHFGRKIIDAVEPFVISVKINIGFFEPYGHFGIQAYERLIEYARSRGLLVIGDVKRSDGGDTANAYAMAHIGKKVPVMSGSIQPPLFVDATTVNASIGTSCVAPFLSCMKETGSGIFIVTKTSFKPNSEPEQVKVRDGGVMWEALAELVGQWGEGTEGEHGYRNVGAVLGATCPEDAPKMRKILPNTWFLIPGYGAQGGGAEGAVVSINKNGLGGLVNSSRELIYAWCRDPFRCESEDFAKATAKAAEFARDDLTNALIRAKKCPWA